MPVNVPSASAMVGKTYEPKYGKLGDDLESARCGPSPPGTGPCAIAVAAPATGALLRNRSARAATVKEKGGEKKRTPLARGSDEAWTRALSGRSSVRQGASCVETLHARD